MKNLIIALIFACVFIASASANGWLVTFIHEGPGCDANKIIHIGYEVDECQPVSFSKGQCTPVAGYDKSDYTVCLASISEIKDKIPEGSTTILVHSFDEKKDCSSPYLHGSYQPVGSDKSCKPGFKSDSTYISSCAADGFEITVCKDRDCSSECSALPKMQIQEKKCTHKGGKNELSYYFSCGIEIPRVNFAKKMPKVVGRDEL